MVLQVSCLRSFFFPDKRSALTNVSIKQNQERCPMNQPILHLLGLLSAFLPSSDLLRSPQQEATVGGRPHEDAAKSCSDIPS